MAKKKLPKRRQKIYLFLIYFKFKNQNNRLTWIY